MVFSSVSFIYIFFPIVFIGYNVLKNLHIKAGNIWLVVASIVFYLFGSGQNGIPLLFSIIINYLSALAINRFRGRADKSLLIFAVTINLLMLGYYKYFAFITQQVIGVISKDKELGIILPLGISFFTFQALSYVIDVYRGG